VSPGTCWVRTSVALLLLCLPHLSACSGLPRMNVPRDPLTAEEHVALGTAYEAQGLKDLAAREFQAALEQRKDYPPALISLGNLSFDAGALAEAEDYYRRVLAADSSQPSANNNLAMVYLQRGERLGEAERLALTALEHGGPLKPYVLETLANIYFRQGRHREVKEALDEAEALAPSSNTILRARLIKTRQELTQH
jgi:tetratricopeptide (TPR) repeat protein